MIEDLLYDSRAQPAALERFPTATFTDASDLIHESRIGITIRGCEKREWYAWLLQSGWAGVSLCFQLDALMPGEGHEVIRELLAAKGAVR